MTAILAQQNHLTDTAGTITVSSEATGYEKENAYDWRTTDWWKPNTSGNAWIKQTFSSSVAADYVAIFAHNFGANGTRVQLRRDSLGGTAASGVMEPAGTEPVISTFNSTTDDNWRIMFYPTQNLLTYSEQIDHANWTKNNVTITANLGTAPDGTSTADLIDLTTDWSGGPYVGQAVTVSVGSLVTASCYTKQGSAERLRIHSIFSGGTSLSDSSYFDFASGTFNNTGSTHTVEVEDVGSGWYRVSISVIDTNNNNTSFEVRFEPNDVAGASIGDDAWVWGAQIEVAPNMGDYVQTTSAQVINSIGQVGVVSFGQRIDLPHGMTPGFAPPGLTFNDETNGLWTIDGNMAGQSLKKKGEKFVIEMPEVLDPSWVRSTYKPFLQTARTRPFFFQWDSTNYPTEVAYCRVDGAIPPVTYSYPSLMKHRLPVRALVE